MEKVKRVLLLLWRALARRLRDVCIRVLVIWHLMTHTIFASFVWAREHARDVLEGAICVHCGVFFSLWESSALVCLSFEEGGAAVCFLRGSRPTVAEARRGMSSWGSQAELADELERGLSFSRSSAANEGELLDDDAISLTSSDPAAGALLGYAQEEQEMSEGEEAEAEPAQSSCPAYDELLEVMERATVRLDLPWKRAKMVAPRGRLDERYLSGHSPPAQVSLPFLPDLHTEVEREWKKPFSARIHKFQHTSYANVEGMRENGYERMPPVEETLASYLSVGETSSLKAPSLPSKPLQGNISLKWQGIRSSRSGWSLRCTRWRCFRLTRLICWKTWIKVRACHLMKRLRLRPHPRIWLYVPLSRPPLAMGRSMAAHGGNGETSVGEPGRYREEREGLSARCSVSPSSFSGPPSRRWSRSLGRRRRAQRPQILHSRRSRSEPEQRRGPDPSPSEDQRWAQRASVAARAPPRLRVGLDGGGSKRGRQDLREVIQTKRSQRSCPDQGEWNIYSFPSRGGGAL